jgi:hypothetical protein
VARASEQSWRHRPQVRSRLGVPTAGSVNWRWRACTLLMTSRPVYREARKRLSIDSSVSGIKSLRPPAGLVGPEQHSCHSILVCCLPWPPTEPGSRLYNAEGSLLRSPPLDLLARCPSAPLQHRRACASSASLHDRAGRPMLGRSHHGPVPGVQPLRDRVPIGGIRCGDLRPRVDVRNASPRADTSVHCPRWAAACAEQDTLSSPGRACAEAQASAAIGKQFGRGCASPVPFVLTFRRPRTRCPRYRETACAAPAGPRRRPPQHVFAANVPASEVRGLQLDGGQQVATVYSERREHHSGVKRKPAAGIRRCPASSLDAGSKMQFWRWDRRAPSR